MEAIQLLSRNEMKMIKGGSGGGSCGIMYEDGTWECGWGPTAAQSWYNNHPGISAYCCESCGEEGYLGAAECAASIDPE